MIDVCLITKSFYPIPAGGAERFRRYAPGLKTRGVQLRVITWLVSDHPPSETLDSIDVLRIPIEPGTPTKTNILLQAALDYFHQTKQPPQILQIFGTGLQNVPYLLRARLSGIACLSVSTTMEADPSNKLSSARSRKKRLIKWLSYCPLNSTIVSSPEMGERLRATGTMPRNLHIIPNGVDTQRFRPARTTLERSQLRMQFGYKPNDVIMLFVGTISPRKGVDLIISAWSQIVRACPQAKLVLIGERHLQTSHLKVYYEKLIEIVSASPIPERVVFMDYTTEIEKYYRAADLFVFPSHHEGWGNAVAEAMASGLPCVLTPFTGLPSGFGDAGKTYLLAKHDPTHLANKIVGLLKDWNLQKKLGEAARSLMVSNFGIDQTLDSYAKLYHQLAKSNDHHPNLT
jgi:glycosyltransferase involved in cell wall biosynthesis